MASAEEDRQDKALSDISDELMSMPHAHQLRKPTIDTGTVVKWLRELYDMVQEGQGKPAHFGPQTPSN